MAAFATLLRDHYPADLGPFGVCPKRKQTEAMLLDIEALAQYPSLSKEFPMFIQLSKSGGDPHALLREGKEDCFP